jgi:hypothetical protein
MFEDISHISRGTLTFISSGSQNLVLYQKRIKMRGVIAASEIDGTAEEGEEGVRRWQKGKI